MIKELEPIIEFAVWSRLDSKTDVEMILLKGHLLIEVVMDMIFDRNDIKNYKNYSFYKKISLLKTVDFKDEQKKEIIISVLEIINNWRNKLAHELDFEITTQEFENLALKILANLQGHKFSKYTFRTKIVHSFSVLSINLWRLTDKNSGGNRNNVGVLSKG